MASERKFTNGEVCAQFTSGKNKEDAKKGLVWILSELGIDEAECDEGKLSNTLSRLTSLHGNFGKRWRDCRSNKSRFESRNEGWLSNEFKVDILPSGSDESSTGSTASAKVGSAKYTAEEALELISDLSLSRQQYIAIRSFARNKNADIYPPYKEVLEAKKRCDPDDTKFTLIDTTVKIDWAD